MLSMQRRLERYRIIYAWKILENLAPNCGIEKVHDSEDSRIGRRLRVSIPKGSSRINKLKEQTFQLNGSKLFNCLPTNIRNQKKKHHTGVSALPRTRWFQDKARHFLRNNTRPAKNRWNVTWSRNQLPYTSNQERPGRRAAAQLWGLGQGLTVLSCISSVGSRTGC